MPDYLDTLLADAKGQEQKQDIAPLIGNYPSMRLLLVWQSASIERADVPDLRPNAPRWQKLWNGVKLDYEEIAMLADIPRSVVHQHIHQARVLGWIYPDGSTHKYARELALASLVKRAGRTTKKKD